MMPTLRLNILQAISDCRAIGLAHYPGSLLLKFGKISGRDREGLVRLVPNAEITDNDCTLPVSTCVERADVRKKVNIGGSNTIICSNVP